MTDNKYPGTDVLINKFDIRNYEQLEKVERMLTAERLYELNKNPLYGSFSFQHLKNIHRNIFQDIYPFAGKVRDVTIHKGNTTFCFCWAIDDESKRIFGELKNEKQLRGLSLNEFKNKMSYYLSEINMLHPFREGNGRTQREFMRLLAMKNGYNLDWTKITKNEMYEASLKSKIESAAFVNIFSKVITNQERSLSLVNEFKLANTNQLEL
ncbi:hypothetical protein BTS2_3376 [Bacillus sp. TS-2]|nr:hypothetical protein BTS2_3376 [Bacillus sp. TS-2]